MENGDGDGGSEFAPWQTQPDSTTTLPKAAPELDTSRTQSQPPAPLDQSTAVSPSPPVTFSPLCSRSLLRLLLLGQFLSVLLTSTGVFSQLLASHEGVSVPTSQSALNYLTLACLAPFSVKRQRKEQKRKQREKKKRQRMQAVSRAGCTDAADANSYQQATNGGDTAPTSAAIRTHSHHSYSVISSSSAPSSAPSSVDSSSSSPPSSPSLASVSPATATPHGHAHTAAIMSAEITHPPSSPATTSMDSIPLPLSPASALLPHRTHASDSMADEEGEWDDECQCGEKHRGCHSHRHTRLHTCRSFFSHFIPRPSIPWWHYFLVALCDVEGNFLLVLAYRYTDITSVQLLDCFTIPVVMVLSWALLKVRYNRKHFMGACICLAGLGMLIASDILTGRNDSDDDDDGSSNSDRHRLIGDLLVLGGCVLYALSNLAQEHLVKNYDRLEFLSWLGICGAIISGIQMAIVERNELSEVPWSSAVVWAYILGFNVCLFSLYFITPLLLQRSSALFLNLSFLTSDFWSLLMAFILFHTKLHPLYFPAFIIIIVGLIIYNLAASEGGIKEIFLRLCREVLNDSDNQATSTTDTDGDAEAEAEAEAALDARSSEGETEDENGNPIDAVAQGEPVSSQTYHVKCSQASETI